MFSDHNSGNYVQRYIVLLMSTSITTNLKWVQDTTLKRFRLGSADLAVNSTNQACFKDKLLQYDQLLRLQKGDSGFEIFKWWKPFIFFRI